MLLVFLILGIIFGSDLFIKFKFENFTLSRDVCIAALIFIIFFGGFGTKISEAKNVINRAIALSTLGVFLTAVGVTIVSFLVLKINIYESFLIGAVVSSTDAASVFSILRSYRLNLKYGTASLLEIESGSNDPMAYILTIAALNFIHGGTSIWIVLIKQVIVAILIGLVISKWTIFVLKKIKFTEKSFSMSFLLGMVAFSYAVVDIFGGNGYLAVYILGILVGNAKFKNKVEIVHFFDGITSVFQMLIFFLLGFLIVLEKAYNHLLIGFIISVFLMFIIRPFVVMILSMFSKYSLKQRLLISWSGLRGASAVIFSMIAMEYSAKYESIYYISFIIVILSLAFQGATIPILSKRLDMIDYEGDVLKTFNDYSNQEDVDFITFKIDKGHEWIGQKLYEIKLMPSVLLVLIIRNGENIIPDGNTSIEENDEVVLCGSSYNDNKNNLQLNEMEIKKDSEYIGKEIKDIDDLENSLIIMIKRNNTAMIPQGVSKIMLNDVLVLLER